MPLPAGITLVPIKRTFYTYRDGTPAAQKQITLTLDTPVSVDDHEVIPKQITLTLDSNGQVPAGLTIAATNDTAVSVTGLAYRVKEHWSDGREGLLTVDHAVSEVDLRDLVGEAPSPEYTAATAAAVSAAAAATSATEAGAQATAAASSASAAATSATAASGAASAAATTASGASTSAATATTNAGEAAASATVAATQATAATTAVSGLPIVPNATGDGTTDDSDALLTAIATGRALSLQRGKTYLISMPLVLGTGQVLHGNGATIKRANQATTTTTATITSGSTNSIAVATGGGAKFKVGQRIAVYNGSNYSTDAPVIQSIVGDTITTATSFHLSAGSPWSGTTTVAHAYDAINVGQDGKIEGLVIDGNKSNWTKYRWETSVEIGVIGPRSTVRNVYLHDCPSDGVMEHAAGDNCVYDNIRVLNCNGNGLHLSGSTNPRVTGFWGKNLNLDTAVGHADGGIILSNGVVDAVIDGFYVNNAISGVASFDSTDNSDLTITNGVIRNCTGTAMEGTFPSGTAANNILISNIRIYNSVRLDINQTSAGSSVFPSRWHMTNVYMEDTRLNIVNARNITLDDVSVNMGSATTGSNVTISNSKNINYNSGMVTGGSAAIYVVGSASERVKIGAGVRVITPNGTGVYFDNGIGADCVAQGVQIYLDSTATASCYGILQSSGTLAQDCVIRMDHGVGIQQNQSNCLTIGNTIRQAAGTSIKNFGGSTGNIAINNLISAAVSNGGGGSNTFTGNVTIPA